MLNQNINNIGLLRSIQKAREASNQAYIDSASNGFTVSRPVSYRTYDAKQNRDANGEFSKGFTLSNGRIADSYKDTRTEKTLPVSSTAIANARYDPSDDSMNITYVNGNKEYKFKAGGQEGIEEWVNAPSKGRITNEWKVFHRYPGF